MGAEIYCQLCQALERQEPAVLRTVLDCPAGRIADALHRSLPGPEALRADEKGVVAPVFSRRGDVITLDEPVLPPERMLLLGAGHVARSVCSFAAACGFQVTVTDDRPDFANRERFPAARAVLCRDFAQAIRELRPGPYDYVVIVTRGHAHDAACLRAVLQGPFPAYVGMIGSRKRVRAQLELLAEEGFSREILGRVCTPIGLSIGSVTPEEIAVSILAQVISYRRLPRYAAPGRWVNGSDLEPETLAALAEAQAPRAVATIMSTRGSSPRKAGAKLVAGPEGLIAGTIGGGLAEARALERAMALMGTGRFEVLTMDLTGDVAAEEGMVCGGVMDVLIEDAV